jgi:hypothetical protein
MKRLLNETVESPLMRFVSLWPTLKWLLVWRNVQMMPGMETMKIRWYQLIHDLVPTNARLHRINLTPTKRCRLCTRVDTLQHRITGCGEGPRIWQWTRNRLAAILRTDVGNIPETWLLQPDFLLWPPKRRRAVLWIIAHMAVYRTEKERSLNMNDYLEFMRLAKWKMNSRPSRNPLVGNYLSIIEL